MSNLPVDRQSGRPTSWSETFIRAATKISSLGTVALGLAIGLCSFEPTDLPEDLK